MKKYSVLDLYVIKRDNYNFICEKVIDNEYREIFTNEKFLIENNDKIESLTKYYSILRIATYKNGKVLNLLKLTKKDILTKYIELNQTAISRLSAYDRVDDFLKRQEEELEGLKLLAQECPELAKKEALEKLQSVGIVDEQGELIGPYKEIFVKDDSQKIPDKVIDMWQDHVENSKDNLPDIPIINVKELKKK